MIYWRLGVSSKKLWGYNVYFKTNNRFIPAMVVDLAVRSGDLLDVFAEDVDEVVEISEEEYFKHMWE
jgi:hypothetical protein